MKKISHFWDAINVVLSARGKKLFWWISAFAALSSFTEALSVSLLAPFLAIATDFDVIHKYKFLSEAYKAFNLQSEAKFVALIGGGIVIVYLARGIITIANSYLIARYSYSRQKDIATRLFSIYLNGSLLNFSKNNSATLTKTIMYETSLLTQLFGALLMIVTELFIFIFLYSLMLYVNSYLTLLLSIFIGVLALILMKSVSRKIKIAGVRRVAANEHMYKALNTIFGNFRILKFQQSTNKIGITFESWAKEFTESNVSIFTFQIIPRTGLELVGFGVMVSGLSLYVWQHNSNIQQLIPMLAVFALALYRLLPSVNRVLTSYNQILATGESLYNIRRELNGSVENYGDRETVFADKIVLTNIEFSYETTKPILRAIDLTIQKGARIAIIGDSGQGKSTLIDILTGLLIPSAGKLTVDGIEIDSTNMVSWRSKIGYVPQSVFLFEASVKDNVLLGRKYDETKLNEVLKISNIRDYLNSKEGIDTMVGDEGRMISGGQKQRIALARALYGNPEVLVLDEATAGLDGSTENRIIDELKELGSKITIINITHRLESINDEYLIYKISDGVISTINR